MIGVIVPVHNEEAGLERCLCSIARAATHEVLKAEPVTVVVVLDSCTDRSAEIAVSHAAIAVVVTVRNVGAARAAGASKLLELGAHWLAFTDGDSTVSSDWLAMQLSLSAEAVCGTVSVGDWFLHSPALKARYLRAYRDVDGHRHVHGANLGVSAEAYRRVGGFPPLTVGEDVALVDALEKSGANIVWSAAPRVTTSARRDSKVSGGFGTWIAGLGEADPEAEFTAADAA